VLYYFATRANTINRLNIVPRGIAFEGGAANIVLGVQNATSNGLTFGSLSGTLYVNDRPLGNVSSFLSTVLAPNSETRIQVRVIPQLLGLASGILDMIEGNETSGINARLQGTANIDNVPLPLNIQF
jgi:LEA14-like dessication related protein